ncbi:hypothetical protein DAPPUDRAFT_99651 [Daphnia pulex]|uniref:Uncharacterized protein n=1 Tax=Daphnia pulex TaxID=6669 RepID=E9G7K1_DAPPU|nr:hypothetical protein DAPPUDRAFT_99651 [Daphnia pulex]|eukprot:EFX84479.1 hypothetical protein DAPPUDRAFT_99651 [Daphnia pulex]
MIFSDVSTYCIRNIITSLLASAPIRNGGIVNAAPILNPVASPIVNTGTAGALVGGGASQVFFSPVRINIDQASQLYVPPGTDGRIIVLLKNDGVGDFFLLSGGRDDKNFFIQFDYAQIQLGPGQTLAVPGRIRVPHYANNVVSTLTIIVQRRTDNAISRRQVYIRTKSEMISQCCRPPFLQNWRVTSPKEEEKLLKFVSLYADQILNHFNETPVKKFFGSLIHNDEKYVQPLVKCVLAKGQDLLVKYHTDRRIE